MKKILHIIPYDELYPPRGGGALRCYHLCNELAKYYDVTVLTFQSFKEVNYKACDLLKRAQVVSVPSSWTHPSFLQRIKNALIYRFHRRSFRGSADITFLRMFEPLRNVLRNEKFDIVVFEHLHSFTLAPVVRRYSPVSRIVIDQHNVDHLLLKAQLSLSPSKTANKLYRQTFYAESNLYGLSDLVLVCSDNDKFIFEMINRAKASVVTVPNGTRIVLPDNEAILHKVYFGHLLFVGTLDYEPNKQGILWFIDKVWPLILNMLPETRLTIIGRNGNSPDYLRVKQAANINFVGEVDSVDEYYATHQIAIVPLLQGSGTRLKILEAMSHGVPVVSTTIGAEGIAYVKDYHMRIADSYDGFANAVVSLLDNRVEYELFRINGMQLVKERYSWEIIGFQLYEELEKLS